jgi:hypothetical protein
MVSHSDTDGLRHSVTVDADSLYEAVVKAVLVFRRHGCEPKDLSEIDVEVTTSVTHRLKLCQVRNWLDKGARSPKEAVTKDRLKQMLATPE